MDRIPVKQKISQHLWRHKDRSIRMGVGCAWLGRGENDADKHKEDASLLMRCYEAGFRYFDTSRAYGDSERVLGEMIRQVDRKTIFLATKATYPFSETDGFDQFKRSFYESFERLQTDHINLFQIHDTNKFNVCEEKVIPFLQERKKEGLIDYIGLGTRSQVAHRQALLSGAVDSALSYMDYNLVKLSAAQTIAIARERQAAFVNSSVLLFGLFKDTDPISKGTPLFGSALNYFRFTVRMKELCRSNNIDIITASLQFSLLNPDIDMTLVGIKRMSNLLSTIDAMDVHIYPEQWAAISALQSECANIHIEDEANYM